jgi:hypothetical protein
LLPLGLSGTFNRKAKTKYGLAAKERRERKKKTANEHETEDRSTADGPAVARGYGGQNFGELSRVAADLRR